MCLKDDIPPVGPLSVAWNLLGYDGKWSEAQPSEIRSFEHDDQSKNHISVHRRARLAELRLEGRTAFPESVLTTFMADMDPDHEASIKMRRLAKIMGLE